MRERNEQVFKRIEEAISGVGKDGGRGLLDFNEGQLQAFIHHESLTMQLSLNKINLVALSLARKVTEKDELLAGK